MDNLTVYNW